MRFLERFLVPVLGRRGHRPLINRFRAQSRSGSVFMKIVLSRNFSCRGNTAVVSLDGRAESV